MGATSVETKPRYPLTPPEMFDLYSDLDNCFQETYLMVGQQTPQPPRHPDDSEVDGSESRSGFPGNEGAQPKGFINPAKPQVHSEKYKVFLP